MLKYILALLLSIIVFSSQGQITEFGIANTTSVKKTKSRTRQNAQAPLSLPFWDDFSTSGTTPDTLRWVNSDAILINDGFAKNSPSIGVASFDGVNAQGLGYSANASSTGKTDSLTSCPIALGGLTAADNIFFNFYYQYGGNGDSPDDSDSIRVDFLNAEGVWINVWPQNNVLSRDAENFEQVVIAVDNEQFFYDGFQFRFQSFGRQSGPFDIWNVDYVYLNDGESADLSFPDRTMSSPLSNIFGEFYSIPASHFRNNAITNPNFVVGSVDDPNDPPQTFSFLSDINVISKLDGVETETSIDIGPFTARQIGPLEKKNETVSIFSDEVTLPEDQDSVAINITFTLDASDNIVPSGDNNGDFLPELYDTLDFRFNDTLRANYVLNDFYAYDDGTAELAAGLNFSGDQVTYQFNLARDTSDNVVAVDMYFPFVGTEPSGKVIDVIILKDLRSEPTSVLYSERVTLGRTETLNEFIRYELRRSTVVTDSFYIGYRQASEGRLGIGLDKSNDSGDRMFFNLDGVWRQNEVVRGSLMLRPVFGEEKIVTSIGPELAPESKIKLYPNPSDGLFNIEGKFDRLTIYDTRGAQINYSSISRDDGKSQIDISSYPQGLYFIKIQHGDKLQTLKMIKN